MRSSKQYDKTGGAEDAPQIGAEITVNCRRRGRPPMPAMSVLDAGGGICDDGPALLPQLAPKALERSPAGSSIYAIEHDGMRSQIGR